MEFCYHWFKWMACRIKAPRRQLNQWRRVANWTPSNKLRWKLHQNIILLCFHSRKFTWKYRMQNGDNFVQPSMCKSDVNGMSPKQRHYLHWSPAAGHLQSPAAVPRLSPPGSVVRSAPCCERVPVESCWAGASACRDCHVHPTSPGIAHVTNSYHHLGQKPTNRLIRLSWMNASYHRCCPIILDPGIINQITGLSHVL